MATDKPAARGDRSLIARIAHRREPARTDERDGHAPARPAHSETVVGLLSEIVACPNKTRHAARLLKIVGGYLAVYLVLSLLIVATLSHWRPSVQVNIDRTVPQWVVTFSFSSASVVATTLLSRAIRRKSKKRNENRGGTSTKVDSDRT